MVFQAHPSLENPLHLLAHSSCATSGDGYLCFVASDFLDAYYSGSATEGDEEWFYGRHLTDGARGWFLEEHTMPLIAEGAAEVLANEAGQSALEKTAAHEARAEARRQREAASQQRRFSLCERRTSFVNDQRWARERGARVVRCDQCTDVFRGSGKGDIVPAWHKPLEAAERQGLWERGQLACHWYHPPGQGNRRFVISA